VREFESLRENLTQERLGTMVTVRNIVTAITFVMAFGRAFSRIYIRKEEPYCYAASRACDSAKLRVRLRDMLGGQQGIDVDEEGDRDGEPGNLKGLEAAAVCDRPMSEMVNRVILTMRR
jgi:hypothetical protein